jgi:hypothetical protein
MSTPHLAPAAIRARGAAAPKSPLQAIVHGAVARHIGIEPDAIRDGHRLGDDLDLDTFDLSMIGLRLEARTPTLDVFPIELLDPSMTVRELCAVYLSWVVPSEVDEDPPDTIRMSEVPVAIDAPRGEVAHSR